MADERSDELYRAMSSFEETAEEVAERVGMHASQKLFATDVFQRLLRSQKVKRDVVSKDALIRGHGEAHPAPTPTLRNRESFAVFHSKVATTRYSRKWTLTLTVG